MRYSPAASTQHPPLYRHISHFHPPQAPSPAPGKREERPRPRPRKFSDPPPQQLSQHGRPLIHSERNPLKAKPPARSAPDPQKVFPTLRLLPHRKQPNSEQKKTSLGCFIVTMYPGIIFKQLRKYPLPPAPGGKGSLDRGPWLGPRGLHPGTGVGEPPARPLPTPRKGLTAGLWAQRRAVEPLRLPPRVPRRGRPRGEGVPTPRETQLQRRRNPRFVCHLERGVKRLPLRAPSPTNFFLFWRAYKTDFFEFETALFCEVDETDFKTDSGGAETGFHGGAKRLLGRHRILGTRKSFGTTLREGGHGASFSGGVGGVPGNQHPHPHPQQPMQAARPGTL